MRHSLLPLACVGLLSVSSAAGCGGIIDGPDCGVAGCSEDPHPPPLHTQPAPNTPPAPGQEEPPSSRQVISCVPSLEDNFEEGTWSPAWWTRTPEGENPDQMVVTQAGTGRGAALEISGQGSGTGYAPAAALSLHTTCFPKRAQFGFDYRIDEGSLDPSREDHAEIAEVTGLDSKGVRCGLLMHVRQGRLSATTGVAEKPRIDLGAIEKATWTRIDMLFEGDAVTFTRDGAEIGSAPTRCVLSDGLVRFSVSGGRS